MELDDELCLCFHVSKRKVVNYIRQHGLKRASQLSECHGAGTGCGWCIPFLRKCFEASQTVGAADNLTAEDYAKARGDYIAAGKGKPPSGRG
jgi:bacterioferritin-associated ferredoxin